MPLSIGKVRVDVGLCGAVPRSCWVGPLPSATPRVGPSVQLSDITSADLNTIRVNDELCSFGRHCSECGPTEDKNRSKTGPTAGQNLGGEVRSSQIGTTPHLQGTDTNDCSRAMSSCQFPPSPSYPRWAVPARRGSKLEPVCEALGSHSSVDLSKRACFRVGRSPSSDVQLLHNTSSRQHAMLFHHPNGSCYVVDCGSSHGTFVNGVRVRSPSSTSMVIPHRVRRGSLIRFGGPGAPSFVLKSFTVGFSSMVKDLEQSCPIQTSSVDNKPRANTVEGGILKKRSFEETLSEPDSKRQRCVSPTCTMLGEIRLVSPDSPRKSKRVSFHDKPQHFPVLVTPDDLSSDEEAGRP